MDCWGPLMEFLNRGSVSERSWSMAACMSPELGEAVYSPGLSVCCLTGQGIKLGPRTSLHWAQSPLPPSESTLAASQTNSALSLTSSHFSISKINYQLMDWKQDKAKSFFLFLSTLSTNSLPQIEDSFRGEEDQPCPFSSCRKLAFPPLFPLLRPLLPSMHPNPCREGE